MHSQGTRRKRKLIKPALQLKLILVFLSVACIATIIQALTLNWTMVRVARELPYDEQLLLMKWPSLLRFNLIVAFVLLVPMTFTVGLYVTFRLTGPLHRFETFLRGIIAREAPEPCRLRKGDDMQDLCQLLNQAVETLRSGEGAGADETPDRIPPAEEPEQAARAA